MKMDVNKNNLWKLLQSLGLLGYHPSLIHKEQNHYLATATDEYYPDPKCYHRIIGDLVYLTITRLELAYAVHILSQSCRLLVTHNEKSH